MKNNQKEKHIVKRANRYFDLRGTVYVVIASRGDVIKAMPLKKDSIVEVWNKDEFLMDLNLLRFTHIPHPPINRVNVSEHLLEYQFNLLGKTMSNTIEETKWKEEWKLSKKQKEMFKSYALGVLKKVFRFNTSKARETLTFFEQNFGLPSYDS